MLMFAIISSISITTVILTTISYTQVLLMLFKCIAALEFAPDFTIISAGFDAARGDPLGCCDVSIFASYV